MNANTPEAGSRPAPDLRTVFEDLQRRAAELLRNSPAADLERNLRALLAQGFDRLDLVSRNEIEQSMDMIAALHKRVDALEQQLRALSGSDPTPPPGR
jgi:BMFP domain-containing protein YqiC